MTCLASHLSPFFLENVEFNPPGFLGKANSGDSGDSGNTGNSRRLEKSAALSKRELNFVKECSVVFYKGRVYSIERLSLVNVSL